MSERPERESIEVQVVDTAQPDTSPEAPVEQHVSTFRLLIFHSPFSVS